MAKTATKARVEGDNRVSKKRSPLRKNSGEGRVPFTLAPQKMKGDVTRIKFSILIEGSGTLVPQEMRADLTRRSFDPVKR